MRTRRRRAVTLFLLPFLVGACAPPAEATTPRNKPDPGRATQASAKTRRAESLGAVGVLRHPGDAEEPEATADLRIVYQGYFRAVGVAFVKGRNFSAGDSEGAPRVVIVDEALAQRLWPRQEALGQRVRLVVGETENASGPWLTVIGVVKHQSGGALEPTTHGQMYLPYPAAGERD